MKFKTDLQTDGHGYWSRELKTVRTTLLDLHVMDDEDEDEDEDNVPDFGELRVFFDLETWNPDRDGLIYTDDKFLEMLKLALFAKGLAGIDIEYSEQGMQGHDFVSLDVGREFIKSWRANEVPA